MAHRKTHFIKLFFIVALAAILIYFYFFGSHGYFALKRMEARVDSLNALKDCLQTELDSLNREIDRLKTANPETIEKLARELGMAREGEGVIIIQIDSSAVKN